MPEGAAATLDKVRKAWKRRLKLAEDNKDQYLRTKVFVQSSSGQFYDAYRIENKRQLRSRGLESRNPVYFVLLGIVYRPDLDSIDQNIENLRELTIVGYKSGKDDDATIILQTPAQIPIKSGVICTPVDLTQDVLVPRMFRARISVSCSCKDFKYRAADVARSAKQKAIDYGAIYGCKHMIMTNVYELKTDAVPPELPNPFPTA